MRISHISLSNWKNFKSVDVEIPERVFLVGPNASGKSNFLDAFRFLRDIALPGGGFQKACMDRGGISKIRCLSARQHPEIEISVDLSEGTQKIWTYEIAFTQDNNRNPRLKKEIVRDQKNGKIVLNRPEKRDEEDPLRLSQTFLEQITANNKFREIPQFFETISYMHLVPQIIRSPGDFIFSNNISDAYGNRFIDHIAKTPEKIRTSRLKKILAALQIAVPQLTDLKLEKDERGIPHLVGTYEHWRAKGAKQNEEQFSDGTLRLLGLLWALLEANGPILLEEPELSLHMGVVRHLASLIYRVQKARKRQVIISTHSADLLSDPGIGGQEILMLKPSQEGTEVYVASSLEDVRTLLEAGMTAADVVFPHTEPVKLEKLDQLELFTK